MNHATRIILAAVVISSMLCACSTQSGTPSDRAIGPDDPRFWGAGHYLNGG